jgi:hypothetical protein
MKTKQCNHCGEHKLATTENFSKKSSAKDGLYGFCKPCKAEKDRAYRKNNKEKVIERRKKYYQANSKRIKAKSRKYYNDNRQDRVDYAVARKRERKRTDPVFRLRERISNAIYCVLFRDAYTGKGSSTWQALPYTPEQLKEHLQAQFDEHMTWDNYGDYWHIDHIYPQSLLPYDSMEHPNFQKCWALDNLQPLEKIENIKKSNKILDKYKQVSYDMKKLNTNASRMLSDGTLRPAPSTDTPQDNGEEQ